MMRTEMRQVSIASLESLFRDLHVCVTLLHDDPRDHSLIRRYLGTIDVIWDSVTGEKSLAYGRPHVFCRPITRKEVRSARGA